MAGKWCEWGEVMPVCVPCGAVLVVLFRSALRGTALQFRSVALQVGPGTVNEVGHVLKISTRSYNLQWSLARNR